MVKSYLRYELKETFGVVVSPTANVLFDGSARLALAPALEHIAVWNLKQGVLVHMLNGDKAEVIPPSSWVSRYHILTIDGE